MNRITLPAHGTAASGAEDGETLAALSAASARLRTARRARSHHLPEDLASGPAWDLLLELHGEDGEVPVTGPGAATRLRWLRILADRGLVSFTPSEPTATLTAKGRATIDGYLAAGLAQGWL